MGFQERNKNVPTITIDGIFLFNVFFSVICKGSKYITRIIPIHHDNKKGKILLYLKVLILLAMNDFLLK